MDSDENTTIYRKKLTDFSPDPRNANRGSERGQYMIDESVEEFGAGRSMVSDAEENLVAGNKTQQALIDAGIEDVIVVETDGTTPVVVKRTDWDLLDDAPDNPARLYAYADNRVGEVSLDWDPEIMRIDLDSGMDLDSFFREFELVDIGAIDAPTVLPPGDADPRYEEAESLAEKWGVKPGTLWRIPSRLPGRYHLILCGDARNPLALDRISEGRPFELLFTDPPYGVEYSGGVQFLDDYVETENRERLEGDDRDMYAEFLPMVIPLVDGPCYLWFADRNGRLVYEAIEENGGEVLSVLYWLKTNAKYPAMNAHYKRRHEPFFYFKRKGQSMRWSGETTETTVWELPRDAENTLHPTQKPISLAERAIGNHDADIILDCFSGSGSTLIAAENKSRVFRGMDIKPGFVAVALQRYADAFGIFGELVEDDDGTAVPTHK